MSTPKKIFQSFSVNGVPQQLYIHLVEKSRGTLFFLHGGPGWSDAPLAHLVCEGLWKDFNLVHWDQRGAGRSPSTDLTSKSMSLEQVVLDGLEVARILDSVFGIQKPVLVGHSWGSMLGVLMASQGPELFKSLIGIGQLVSNAKSEPLSLEYCKNVAKVQGRDDLLVELSKMDSGFYKNVETLFRQREILFELGGEFKMKVTQDTFLSWMSAAPLEYHSTWEVMMRACEFSMKHLWSQVIEKTLPTTLSIPITILQGRHDYCTVSSVAHEWFELLEAPKKQWMWFESSGHWPQLEENKKWTQAAFAALFG